jgi:hypothetical protein
VENLTETEKKEAEKKNPPALKEVLVSASSVSAIQKGLVSGSGVQQVRTEIDQMVSATNVAQTRTQIEQTKPKPKEKTQNQK